MRIRHIPERYYMLFIPFLYQIGRTESPSICFEDDVWLDYTERTFGKVEARINYREFEREIC